MIRLKSILTALSISFLLLSCHWHHGRTIVISDGHNRTEIVSRGNVQFTSDSTAIKSISPGGYISYEKNERMFRAERDTDGSVYLEMYNNGQQISLDADSKAFLAAAVKEMTERNMGRILKE